MDETKMTAAEMLVQVNTAITKIGSRSLTRADLAMLKSMRDDLEAQLATEESGPLMGRTYVAYFDGR